jgi:RNA polymerase sigma-70 factor (family 1)
LNSFFSTFRTQNILSLLINNEDITLTAALTRDNLGAFDALYHKYHNAVFANIFKLVKQQEAAEDLLQDVFVALWENRKKIDSNKSVGGWLFVVSHNKAIKFLNKAVREKIHALEDAALTIAETSDNEFGNLEYQSYLINKAIDNLPPKKREVFTLCKLEGKTYEEAARAAGISPHTVKEYVSAASKFVKAYSLQHYALNTPISLSVLITLLNHL